MLNERDFNSHLQDYIKSEVKIAKAAVEDRKRTEINLGILGAFGLDLVLSKEGTDFKYEIHLNTPPLSLEQLKHAEYQMCVRLKNTITAI